MKQLCDCFMYMPRSHGELRAVPVATGPYDLKPIRACDPWYSPYEIEPLAMFWSHANGWCTGFSTVFLQFRYDVLAKVSQEPVRLPYG